MNDTTQAQWRLSDRIANLGTFLWAVLKEIYEGVRRDRIPAHRYCYFGIVLAIALLAHADEWFARAVHRTFHLSHAGRVVMIYCFLASGWALWGIRQAFKRNELLTKLGEAFEAAKLKCNGKYPSLIEDVSVDDHVRRLRLKTNGVTMTEIEAALEKLETMLNVSIVRVTQEDGDKSRVDLIYTYQDLPRMAYLEDRGRYVDAEIPIGLTHEGPLAVNLREVGHILLCGQTGGGKSNWLKVTTSVLAANNPESEILFLDFKGGMESGDLKQQLNNVRDDIGYYEGTKACVKKLMDLGANLDIRLQHLSACGAASLDDYLKKRLARNLSTDEIREEEIEKRMFIVVDEVAQLYARDGSLDASEIKAARAAVNRIARQGRAAGVHLILTTQKPDTANFDATVKANMPGVLCFPMANQASSVAAVGSKRAYELNPNIKGRAIWKFGPGVEEVQTYLFS